MGVYDLVDGFDWVHSDSVHTGFLDVSDPHTWEDALAEFAAAAGGGIDVVVNNAGILYGGPFMEEGSYDKDAQLVDVNVKGVLFGARAAYPWLKDGGGKLVNIASASAIYGTPDMAVYSATKFAIRGITEALELEWAEEGIDVASVWPLYAATGMLDGVETSGTRRLGVNLTPAEVARAVADVVEAPRRSPIRIHHPVGRQAKLAYLASRFSPTWLCRYINAKLTSDRPVRL